MLPTPFLKRENEMLPDDVNENPDAKTMSVEPNDLVSAQQNQEPVKPGSVEEFMEFWKKEDPLDGPTVRLAPELTSVFVEAAKRALAVENPLLAFNKSVSEELRQLPDPDEPCGPYCTGHEGKLGRPCPIHVGYDVECPPHKRAPEQAMIGFLTNHPSGKGYGFLCHDCAVPPVYVGAPVYGVNLNPYKATCVVCKRVVVQGCGTELFSGE